MSRNKLRAIHSYPYSYTITGKEGIDRRARTWPSVFDNRVGITFNWYVLVD